MPAHARQRRRESGGYSEKLEANVVAGGLKSGLLH
jgi:hypothetical protein